MRHPLCIYHGNCADGFSAAWVFWHHSAGHAIYDFHAGVYQDPPPDVDDRRVYMVDFAYKLPVMEEIIRRAQSVTLLDHHKSAIDDLAPLRYKLDWRCDIEHSGAMLAWRYCYGPKEPPALLRHVEDRDLWRFKLEGTREIQAALFSYHYDFELWERLMMGTPIETLRAEGVAIERKHWKDVRELVAVTRHLREIGGYIVPCASLPYTLTSDAGHMMAKGEPFAACYWDTPEGRVYSLRSTDEGLDVSEIAKQYGGGGHRNASGFRVPYNHELAGPPA